jgi:uncharacterized protein
MFGKSYYHPNMSKGGPLYAVKRTKTGLGLVAAALIPAETRIIEYTGPLVPNEEVERRRGKYFFALNSKWAVDGSPRGNIARYVNHSCDPNSVALVSGRRIWIWAKRDIRPGEEITYDYGREYFETEIKPKGCKCKKCLGRRT